MPSWRAWEKRDLFTANLVLVGGSKHLVAEDNDSWNGYVDECTCVFYADMMPELQGRRICIASTKYRTSF
jgi:hypothetical protein